MKRSDEAVSGYMLKTILILTYEHSNETLDGAHKKLLWKVVG